MKTVTKNDHVTAIIAVALICLYAGFAIGVVIFRDAGYKEGQIDAINGKIQYELKYEIDSTYQKIK